MDYEPLNEIIVTFDDCVTRRCVMVTITDDGVDELDEFFTYQLRRTTGLDSRIQLDTALVGRIEIVDDDGE